MLRIDPSKPFKLVYSLCRHEFFGYVVEPHIVQLNQDGDFSLTYQRIFSNTMEDFTSVIDESDRELIRLCGEIEQSALIKKLYKKPVRTHEFFAKIFDQKLFDQVRPRIDKKLNSIINLLKIKKANGLYLMSKEGWPVERALSIAPEAASVLFHFRRNDEETRYFPTIKYQGHRIEFMFKNAQVISNEPAWMLLEDQLYFFEQSLDGKKLAPFLNKRFIAVPKKSEATYFERFVTTLIAKHHVYAEGFDIITHQHDAKPVLQLRSSENGISQLNLLFRYGLYSFPAGGDQRVTVRLEHNEAEDQYIFHRIKRSRQWESNQIKKLEELGLVQESGLFSNLAIADKSEDAGGAGLMVDWINQHYNRLNAQGFEILQDSGKKKYLLGQVSMDVSVEEGNDWFDVRMMVRFGAFEIPFIELKDNILTRNHEYMLPDGSIALIPEAWFNQFSDFFLFSSEKDQIKLKKHHLGLIQSLEEEHPGKNNIRVKLEALKQFGEMQEYETPASFKGSLRPYQQAGYNWFHFLKRYGFGGCLADDMGLGKTVQTLALLGKEREEHAAENLKSTSLIVLPTSLIYNWQREAGVFAPDLRIYVHSGANRVRSADFFAGFDLVLTTYGITRIDEEILTAFYFNYVILDESQHIKNPTSKSFRAVRRLKGKHRLILTGTPIENTVADIWPQMTFLNPGLLGRHRQFAESFVNPIEKKKDEKVARKLQALIKPFILRRTKEQVATELPPKIEQTVYCELTGEQEELYEQTKSEYRNLLLGTSSASGVKPSIALLQGLTRLRQLANHPKMLDPAYEGLSGKFVQVVETLEQVLKEQHKVLIFSQFVRQLEIYRDYFDRNGYRYAYLDGSTKDRESAVNAFRNDEDTNLFLISIKAGGVGLNLIEADYVFLLDPWWNPAVEQQAIDRSHRIGQTKNVFIYRFISKDTVEEKILALQSRKRVLADQLVTTEESFVKSLTRQDIEELLK